MNRKVFLTHLIAATVAFSFPAFTAEVKDVLREGSKRTDSSASRQKTINGIVDEKDKMFREYRQLLKRNETLRAYISLKEDEVKRQQEQIKRVKEDINKISQVVRETAPLMHKMTDTLESFINQDVPFLLEERTKRINTLRQILRRPDVSESEKFRKVLEAYQIELEFGNTIETYQSNFRPTDGAPDEIVNYLRIGRISLITQKFDGSGSYMWDVASKSWLPVSDAVYAKSLKEGIKIASKRSAPDLLTVPVVLTIDESQ